ncbi:uncharacterized protein SCHCODRAFT_02663843 [Schizophyllum commune H4-8]|uniref:Uncharacterized protein n=1 Tax=Schizophyllum commune (strain H4-8 / FGSC 9210) TaxID=578458 RepID=D8PYH6_SCHCM|nr:uncharacterized protein SCHCODRAFT_02663843 [Schizophyllum commune H4-8]KAI5895966.1 hypothetical protein SCHCODRAFT_02663843 [Schizophyllum commune H4-8]
MPAIFGRFEVPGPCATMRGLEERRAANESPPGVSPECPILNSGFEAIPLVKSQHVLCSPLISSILQQEAECFGTAAYMSKCIEYRCLHTCGTDGGCPILHKNHIRDNKGSAYKHAKAKKHRKSCNPDCRAFGKAQKDTIELVSQHADEPGSVIDTRLKKFPDRELTIVFVADPVLGKDVDSVTVDHGVPHVTVINVTQEQVQQLEVDTPGAWAKELPESVHADTEPDPAEKTVKVAQWEWVRFRSPPKFTFQLVNRNNRRYGVNTIDELDEYLASATQLMHKAVMFPDPWELLYSSSPPMVNHVLDLASVALNGCRPYASACYGCTPDDFSSDIRHLASLSSDMSFAIVREDGEDSVRPENIHLRRIWVKKVAPDPPSTDWLGLPHHSGIHRKCSPLFGELMVYIVGGDVTHVVQLGPVADGDFMSGLTPGPLPLHICDKRRVFESYRTVAEAWATFCGWDEDATERKQGYEELRQFALSNLSTIMKLERKVMEGDVSDLQLLCRMDVGLLQCSSGLKYYVKNLERGLTTSMMGWMDWQVASGDINQFVNLLPAFVCARQAAKV